MRSPIRTAAVLAVAIALSSAAAGRAETCEGLFPDFGDCDREVRPDGSVMPVSFPYIFEDPYIATGLNFVGIWHQFPDESAFDGGDIGVLALQARLAITDRLAFIATKDGLGFLAPDNPILDDENGFFNISAGLKYAALEWKQGEQSAILTPSLRYEIPLGNRDVFQGAGDGLFIPALSGAFQHGDWHVIAGLGGSIPVNHDKNSSNIFYNVHVDHAFPTGHDVVRYVVPFIELSGIAQVASGDGSQRIHTKIGTLTIKEATNALGLTPFEGVDVVNLGSDQVAGHNVVTMAWGVRLPLWKSLSFGAAYERPLSNRKDIFEQRVTTMLTWEM